MPTRVHERERPATVATPPPRRRRHGRAFALAWSEAVLRKARRAYNDRTVGTRRKRRSGVPDLYGTFPERLSPLESDRLAEIIRRHPE
jgi:hypothetical protein